MFLLISFRMNFSLMTVSKFIVRVVIRILWVMALHLDQCSMIRVTFGQHRPVPVLSIKWRPYLSGTFDDNWS